MSANAEKARAQRLQRLRANLEVRLDHPEQAVEIMMSELQAGETLSESWERLHAAAARDGKEAELAQVYGKITVERRLKQLPAAERTSLLLHAADFFQGIVGDGAAAEGYLLRVLEAEPDHADAFARLDRRYSAAKDTLHLIELYALVSVRAPKPKAVLATGVLHMVSQLPKHSAISDEACRKLLVLLPESPTLLGLLEVHCTNTGRSPLACALLEQALTDYPATKTETVERQRHLVKLYLGEANAPAKAITHVEDLLVRDPSDSQARAAAERLLREPQVASRAAAALQVARRDARDRG
jgi:tetratricopeptide (TPR) repeat protein